MPKRHSNKDSGLTTTHKVMIAVAILGAIGYFAGGPAYDSMYKERAIIEISFGNIENYPLKELQFDGSYYFVDIVAINRGKSQTNPTITITTENAKVSFNKIEWNDKISQSILIYPSGNSSFYRFYVLPDENFKNFSLKLVSTPILIHEKYDVFPLTIQYALENGKYKLINAF